MKQIILKIKLKEKHTTQRQMADYLGISLQSFNGKLNGRYQFTLQEMVEIVEILDIKNPSSIFFENDIPNMQQNGEG